MTVSALSDLIALLPEFDGVGAESARIAGLLGAARPAVVAALSAGRPMLVVTAHTQSALDFAAELQRWLQTPVGYYPAIESLPYERVHVDRDVLAQRESVLHGLANGDIRVVVAPVRALAQPVAGPNEELTSVHISAGDSVRPDDILRQWVQMGYVETRVVEDPGTFARRGGVIDVFPAGADSPVRIDLFGNDVESLRSFDPSTQRSTGAVGTVELLPIARLQNDVRAAALKALRGVDTASLTAEAETRWREDLVALEHGSGLDELVIFAPYLIESPCSLTDHLPDDAIVVVDSAAETWTMLSDLWDQSCEVQTGMEERGTLPAGLRAALLRPNEVEESIRSRVCLELVTGSSASASFDLSAVFTPAHVFGGRFRDLVRDLTGRKDERVVLATHQPDRLAELLTEENLQVRLVESLVEPPIVGLTMVPAALAQGWSCPAARIVLLTDHEIFGRSVTRQVVRKKRAAREAFFFDYSPGDYVVHLEHGIGRFEGVTRMAIEGAEREYAIVQFAGKDRVYVPTDQLERLTRYVGAGEAAPQLSKLGGGEWQRVRSRAKAAAADIARELIELYAKRRTRAAHAFSQDGPWERELESSFAYEETTDQAKAIDDVKHDMEEPHPMDRLVCADVGYGKTEVAVRATFKAVLDGKQVAVLCPTTILAQQHFETFSERYSPFPVKVEVLSRFRTPAQQREILRRLTSGEVDVVIGTHRLLQKDVVFKDLGLLIVDEEQRFGVKHKEALKRFRESVDVLTLTATPIPRTLHSGLVGIREISVIETPPEGRLPIKTHLQPFDDGLVREAVLRELDRDGQVYIVHNKVATIDAMAERLRRLTPEARIVVAHGQMEDEQLEKVMMTFAHHEADVLLCSTIIENGLDIPNVNTIIVNNAHRLGLTQLYQLRGRVGRSANQAYAYLLYPLDAHLSHTALQRMEAVFEAQDLGAGFSIAMKDLEIRGTGNLLGAEQSGHATAIGFDLYTRMIGDAVERLRGVPVEEPPAITVNVPLTMLLPADYIGSEQERLTLYRRLANVASEADLRDLEDEIRDRFGALPLPVQNLVTVVHLKLLARAARVISISLDREFLTIRTQAGALYDRVSLYRRYGLDAKISNALLKIPRSRIGENWEEALKTILQETATLQGTLAERQAVPV
jgi:transcription-repair coupling factor (superfamily II helicase)